MLKNNKTTPLLLAALAVLVIVVFFVPSVRVLSLYERKNPAHKIYSRLALNGFVISYTHSVNKGRVHDYYSCGKDGTLTVNRTVFVSYGAGIPEPEETAGASFKSTPDGYEISGLNRTIPFLVMAVGVVAEHSITIGSREVLLKTLFAPQTSLVIKVEIVSLLSYITAKKI